MRHLCRASFVLAHWTEYTRLLCELSVALLGVARSDWMLALILVVWASADLFHLARLAREHAPESKMCVLHPTYQTLGRLS